MALWRLQGCYLAFRLPAAVLDPVLPFVDEYMTLTREDGGAPVEIVRHLVRSQGPDTEILYELPVELFDCRSRRLTANCLLVEDGIARIEFGALDRSGLPLAAESPESEIVGAVDYFDGERVRGWALAKTTGAKALQVGVFVDGRLATLLPASELRRDIARKHGGDGRCGFQGAMPDYLFDGVARVLCVAPMSTLRPLRNGHMRIDLPTIEDKVAALIRNRIERLQSLLE